LRLRQRAAHRWQGQAPGGARGVAGRRPATAMPGRVYVTPQGGRSVRQPEEDEPWGTSASRSSFRHFEPAEARSCRSEPVHLKPCLEQHPATGSRAAAPPASNDWKQGSAVARSAGLSAISVPTGLSAYTVRSGASSGAGPAPGNAHEERHQQPMARRPFCATSAYRRDQESAQEARRSHFPYRDEFVPRSKQLLLELALEKCSRESVKSASTAGSVSCFTVESSAHGGRRQGGSRALSAVASEPSLASTTSRIRTADSRRIPGGVGSLARRRKEADLRAPGQWEPDRQWHAEKWETDGPAGLTAGYYGPSRLASTCRNHSEDMNLVEHMVTGRVDHAARERPSK